ncbi:cob(I)yrinic acid a,c-diamide adenosyltransferase [Candidatus Woesearchaeota archaeon]|nr:cob(I)yrinic acid a,c-diamide adenosyltransferase [Candidatus Woesearchaeota archaeon]
MNSRSDSVKKGLVHAYIGEGKGKTTAAVGLALRAVGQNILVYMVQFMKGGRYTGEILAAERFLNGRLTIRQFGRGCIREDKQLKIAEFDEEQFLNLEPSYVRDDEPCGSCRYCFVNDKKQKRYCDDAYAHARKIVESGDYGLVILDELVYAVTYGMLPLEKALELIANKPDNVELVITGGAWQGTVPQELLDNCDLVTEMTKVKHYYEAGVLARRGVEY